MGDILTQMQDELDLLLHRMSTALHWIRENAPPSVPPGQQRLDTFAELEARNAVESNATQTTTAPSALTQAPTAAPNTRAPIPKEEFDKDMKEFAEDIVSKEQQIEQLIAHLPGLDFSEKEQIARMKELERQLEELEGERIEAVKEKERMLKLVEGKILSVGRMR
ncbi:Mediator complex subunit 21 [Plenodomus tracheiphilus IPT5]|uniref:Mediator of RNA polymerase II transcription subunit 21 n=1 Tax=Plenodomus tracheiphilus IPT5 TaxID=1408161 RepID=A0A6A7B2L3_9PLEO|nr:Mediator complex subunit 21 [Plenodomus tracheiphilus IPT5]